MTTVRQHFASEALAPSTTHPVSESLPQVEDPSAVTPRDARALSKVFFDRLAELEEGTAEYQYARNTLIELNLNLVKFAARRFRDRAEEREDVVQVGTIGLIKAIDRFDLSREVEFTTFALPYIRGEIKRHFRDTTWSVHVPRRLQELRIAIAKASEKLAHDQDRDPTPAELAEHLQLSEDEVREGLVAASGYTASSLDLPVDDGDEGSITYADCLGDCDPALDSVEDIETLKQLIAELDERDRLLLQMRFGQEMTQSEIGAELGLSQMHISRLLTRIFRQLREGMLTQH
ncbi:RNA polymerase sigma factor SigF [Streptomyces sp. NPDC048639]|uniref:RNA polymerase sigma factor SigF n=1 Tax=Streptomyces sp. NPDC048639 TaxID=3365581 RepID=UPI00371C47B5